MHCLLQTLFIHWLTQHEIDNRRKRLEQEKIVIDTRRMEPIQVEVLCERVDNKRTQSILIQLVRDRWIICETFEFQVLSKREEIVIAQLSLKEHKYPTD